MAAVDAERMDLREGDMVEVRTPRGATRGRLRITGMRPGVVFVPFHYGYWDTASPDGPDGRTPPRAANEATVTDWDPASKQPLFKMAAASLTLVERGDGSPSPAPTTAASAPVDRDAVPETAGGPAAHVRQTSEGRRDARGGGR